MAKARAIPGFGDADSFRAAAAVAVETRAEEVFEHSGGVLDMTKIEGVHDMRVATRRLRAAMEIFEACFPPKDFKRLLKEVKALADALGERRDRDVAIAGLDGAVAQLTATERPGLRSLQDELRAEQERANEHMAGMLEQIEADRLRERLLALAAEARPA